MERVSILIFKTGGAAHSSRQGNHPRELLPSSQTKQSAHLLHREVARGERRQVRLVVRVTLCLVNHVHVDWSSLSLGGRRPLAKLSSSSGHLESRGEGGVREGKEGEGCRENQELGFWLLVVGRAGAVDERDRDEIEKEGVELSGSALFNGPPAKPRIFPPGPRERPARSAVRPGRPPSAAPWPIAQHPSLGRSRTTGIGT